MGLMLRNGDYVSDGHGGFLTVTGKDALAQRVTLRLTARRGSFPFLENFGSRLWQLGTVPAARHQGAAEQYVAEALAEESGLAVESVELTESGGTAAGLRVGLRYQGGDLTVRLSVQ
jgi:hypothetical protein